MRTLLKSTKDLLSEDLSIAERGVLITIILLKDSSPKMTLAKLKGTISINQIQQELISLHEKGYIDWSEYKKVIRRKKKKFTKEFGYPKR